MTTAALTHSTSAAVRHAPVLVVSGLTAIALHVLDDAVVHPERGTNLGDHLTSTLALITLFILAAASSSHIRAGSLAAISLALGAFGIAVGSEAFESIANGGLAGDAYTALFAATGGAMLIATGTSLLWDSRSRDGRWWRRMLRRLGYAAGAAAITLMLVVPLVYTYVDVH